MALLPFDPSTYMVEVVKPYSAGTKSGLPSVFERYRLDPAALTAPTESDLETVARRCDDVHALWAKHVEHARFGVVCKALRQDFKDQASLILGDRRELGQAATDERREAQQLEAASAEMLEQWRALLAEYVAQGGLLPHHREVLAQAAAQRGLDRTVVARDLAAAPEAEQPDALSNTVREEIRTRLRDFARDTGEENRGLTLYHALGLPGLTDDLAAVRSAHAELSTRVRQMTHSQAATTARQLLSLAQLHLLDADADPRAYVESVVEDVIDGLTFEAAQVASDGRIDPNEAESLLQSAMMRGLTPELGRRVVVELARRQNAVVESSAPVDYVSCPACNAPHPRPTAPSACRRCSTALFIVCPADGCGTTNDAVVLRCAACRVDLRRYAEATRRLPLLSRALDDGRVGWASDEFAEIKQVLGVDAVPADLRQRIDRAQQESASQWSAVEQAIHERRLFSARVALRRLTATSSDVAGPTGAHPAGRLEEVERRIVDVDAALARARGATGRAREQALVDAITLAVDCEEAASALAALPLAAPTDARAVLESGSVIVSWEPASATGVTYEVRRFEGASDVGAEVGSTPETTIEDRAASAGAVVRYEVRSRRGGASSSSAARTADVLVAREVEALTVTELDGEIRLGWQPVAPGARVIVERSVDGEGGVRTLDADRTGLVDRTVRNGGRYGFHVAVEYGSPGGQRTRTPGLTVFGQPVAPPEAIHELRLSAVGGGVLVRFARPSTGSVTVLRCTEEPGVQPGDAIDLSTLDGYGSALPMSPDGARDGTTSGVCWYLPVTVAGGTAVAGRAIRHVALAAVDHVRLVAGPGEVRVTWQWPDDVRVVQVLWRRDSAPQAADEPGTDSAVVRLGEYRDHGGFTIPNPGRSALFTAIASALRIDGQLVIGSVIPPTARGALQPTQKQELRYAVKRGGLLRKRLDVTVLGEQAAELPDLVLVGRSGDLLPRTSADGEIIARLGGGHGNQASFDLGRSTRPLTVRLFLATGGAASSYVVLDPTTDNLVIH